MHIPRYMMEYFFKTPLNGLFSCFKEIDNYKFSHNFFDNFKTPKKPGKMVCVVRAFVSKPEYLRTIPCICMVNRDKERTSRGFL